MQTAKTWQLTSHPPKTSIRTEGSILKAHPARIKAQRPPWVCVWGPLDRAVWWGWGAGIGDKWEVNLGVGMAKCPFPCPLLSMWRPYCCRALFLQQRHIEPHWPPPVPAAQQQQAEPPVLPLNLYSPACFNKMIHSFPYLPEKIFLYRWLAIDASVELESLLPFPP